MVSDPWAKTPSPAHTRRRGRASRCATGGCRCCSGSARSSRSPAPGRSRAASSPPARRSSSRSAATWRPRSTCASSPTSSSSTRAATPIATRCAGSSRPPTSGSSRPTSTRRCRPTRAGTRSTRCPALAFDHAPIVLAGRERLRAKLSYTNIGFALAPARVQHLRAARPLPRRARPRGLGDEPAARARCAATCSSRPASGASPAPPAAGRRRSTASPRPRLEVTDPFAVLRPPAGDLSRPADAGARRASRRPAAPARPGRA